MKIALLIFVSLFADRVFSQEEYHNKKVDPEKIDCHKMPAEFYDIQEAIKVFSKTNFRYTEQFKTGKTSGVMTGKFYSCDNNLLGYLAIKIDGLYLIYQEIPSRIWKEFSGSNDLDAYYLEHIRGSYTVLAREE